MLYNPLDNRSLYNLYDFGMRLMQPYSDSCAILARRCKRLADTMNVPVNIPFATENQNELYKGYRDSAVQLSRWFAAFYYVNYMVTDIYDKPGFEINEIQIGNEFYDVYEEVIDRKSFCNLLHFRKNGLGKKECPKMLLVAPMSGHYATLLRDTVRSLLPYYDVYITDWKNARDVPLVEGSFDLNDYIDYVISYFKLLGPHLNVMAVCQPTVPVLAALALMSTENTTPIPQCVFLLGGPIDTHQSPTIVDELAASRGDDWFEQNVISMVPTRFPGAMRLVYPGFMQLSGFMSMNLQRHIESLKKAMDDYAGDNHEEAFKTIRFYLEYFATMDLTAEFYMQTINTVFQQNLLVKGHYKSKGREIRLQDIKNTSILIIEGEKDDITGIGQTKSVMTLCINLPDSKKMYHLAKGVGHYGLFNGSRFRQDIIPIMNAFVENQK